jgi:hypothetical protein
MDKYGQHGVIVELGFLPVERTTKNTSSQHKCHLNAAHTHRGAHGARAPLFRRRNVVPSVQPEVQLFRLKAMLRPGNTNV